MSVLKCFNLLTSFYSKRFEKFYLNVVIWRRFEFVFTSQVRLILNWIIWRTNYSTFSIISFSTYMFPIDLRIFTTNNYLFLKHLMENGLRYVYSKWLDIMIWSFSYFKSIAIDIFICSKGNSNFLCSRCDGWWECPST